MTQIIVGKEGWVFIGDVERDGDYVVLQRAHNIRWWGTSKGLGELIDGPTANTKLDALGVVRLHALNVVAGLEADPAKWKKPLGKPRETPFPRDGLLNTEIVIAERRWVFVGAVRRDGDYLLMQPAWNIRKWTTGAGLGPLAANGPANAQIDFYGAVRTHALAVVAQIDCAPAAWSETFSSASRAKRGSP